MGGNHIFNECELNIYESLQWVSKLLQRAPNKFQLLSYYRSFRLCWFPPFENRSPHALFVFPAENQIIWFLKPSTEKYYETQFIQNTMKHNLFKTCISEHTKFN